MVIDTSHVIAFRDNKWLVVVVASVKLTIRIRLRMSEMREREG